jgi:hypothetical protein
LQIAKLTMGSGSPALTMMSRSIVSRAESVRERISGSARRRARLPGLVPQVATAAVSSARVARGDWRHTSPSPAMIRSSQESSVASWHQVSTASLTLRPLGSVDIPTFGSSSCPRTPRSLGARRGDGTETSRARCTRSSGSLKPNSTAAVQWLKYWSDGIREAYATARSAISAGRIPGIRVPWKGRLRSLPRSRPAPTPSSAASLTLNGREARIWGSG